MGMEPDLAVLDETRRARALKRTASKERERENVIASKGLDEVLCVATMHKNLSRRC